MPFKFNPFTKKQDYYEIGGGGSTSWGSITGNLQDQIDLKNELDSKADINHNHSLNDLSEKSYNSLTDKPIIPTKTSDLLNDSGFIDSESDPIWNSEKNNYYTKIQTDNLLSGKSNTGHTHIKSEITNLEEITTTASPNSIPKSDANGKIDNGWLKTGSGNGFDADTLDGQHASDFASSSHNHDDRYYTETELSTSDGGGQVHWNNITNKPSTYPPSSHTHLLADITNAGTLASKNTISTNDVDNDSITYAKIQNVSTNNRFLGRITAGSGDVEEITASQAKSILAITKSDISDFAHQSSHQSGGSDAITGNLDAIARTTIRKNSGTDIGSRRRLNFIEGSNVTITTTDDQANEEIDITISSIGGGVTDGDKGDITVSGGGTTWTIDNDAVTFSKIQNIATDKIIGRDTTGTGDPEEISVGGGIEFTGTGGIQVGAFTGDVTKTAGGTTLTIADNAVTNTKLRDSSALSVIGRSSNTSGDPADIVASANDTVLIRTSDALSFGQVNTTMIENKAVTYSKIQDVSASNRLLGRITTGSGQIEELTPTQVTSILDVFTSTDNGLVPASGGGTTNFLRADGTWAAPPSGGGGGGLSILFKTSNQSNSTTTGENISDLTISLSANQKLFFYAFLVCSSAATTTGIQLAINGPASPTRVDATIIGWTSATAIATTGINAYETYQANTASAGTTRRVFQIFGIILNGPNNGTFALRFKSEVAGSAVTVYSGSYMHYYVS